MNIFEDWCLAKILGKSGPGPFQEINLDNIPKILISLIFYE